MAEKKTEEKTAEETQCDAAVYYARGLAHFRAGEYRKAISEFTRVLEADEDFVPALIYRARAYVAVGEYASAIDDFTDIPTLPDDPEVYYAQGLAHFHTHRPNWATDDFEKVIELNPSFSAQAYIYCARAYARQKEHDDAIECLAKATERFPNDAEVFFTRGVIYHRIGDSDKALADFTRAIELNPNHADARFHRGTIYYACGDYARASEDFLASHRAHRPQE